MALALNYEQHRQRSLASAKLDATGWFLLSVLLAVGAGICTYLAIERQLAPGLGGICGLLTVVFILTSAMLFSDLLSASAERPADIKTVRALMLLVDELGNRQEFMDEIATLLREQGELYQYQAHAIILATKKLGISSEEMQRRERLLAERRG
jgi:hypothetical protein